MLCRIRVSCYGVENSVEGIAVAEVDTAAEVEVAEVEVAEVEVAEVEVAEVEVAEVEVAEAIPEDSLEHQHEWLHRLCMTDNYPACLQRRLEVVSGRSSEDR